MATVVGLLMLGLALVGFASDRLWTDDSGTPAGHSDADEAPPTL